MPDKYIEDAIEETEELIEEPEPTPSYATKDEVAGIKGAIDNLTLQFSNFGQVQQQPAAPKGPTIAEQTAAIDEQLVKLDTAMDEAIAEGKSVSTIQRKREELIQYKTDLKYDTKIQELQSFGVFAIDQLTDKVVASEMPMLKYPEVKKAYDKAISTMAPDQRMNPEVRMTAYNYARGMNQELIFDKMFEERMRKDEEVKVQEPTGKSGRDVSQPDDPNRIPDPSEILDASNLQAIEAAGKTVESYYKSLGYPGGWEEYWIKTGKPDRDGEEKKDE